MLRRLLASVLAVAASLTVWAGISRADGLIVISNPQVVVPGHFSFAPLEVSYHKVDTAIKDQLASTSVDQEFYNPNNARLEGDYIFPIPANAQLNNFAMDIDGKMVQAEMLPADKARSIYQEIVRQTRDPALLEYAGRAMFRVHIFPIEPHSRKHIKLSYTELLKQDNGLLDYHYTLNTEKFSSKPLQNVSLKVTIASSEPITTLYSPTHQVDIARHGDNSATVGFEAQNVRPDTDFHLYIGRKATPVGINLLTYRPDPDKEGYFVLLASPTLSKDVKALPKDVVFVMDTSGSMADSRKIDQARQALKYCINTLNEQDRFDIVRFSTEAEPLFQGLKEANDANRAKAQEFAAGLKAAGGTAIDEALARAMEERPADAAGQSRLFMVVFMTDGQPTIGESDPDKILAHMKDAGKGALTRVFSFGVGSDVNTRLLDVVAEQTRGYAQYVLPNENLELSMSNFWSKVQDPILAGLKLDVPGATLSKITPKDMPDLFKGDQLVVFGTYNKAGKTAVTITGMVNGKEQRFSQDVTFDEKTDSSRDWIAKLWATRRVGYLLDEIRAHGESKEVKDEIVELARRWGVVTPYTAMLIIEDERRRNIPLAERSLREMETDRLALGSSLAAVDSLRHQDTAGGQAVANSVNTAGYKQADNMQAAQALAEQSQSHVQFDGASALAKAGTGSNSYSGGTIVSGGAPSIGGGFGGGGVGGRGGRGGGGGLGGGAGGGMGGYSVSGAGSLPLATQAAREQLNLGSNTTSGWQTNDGKDAAGYRAVNNYAQQSRIINNRSFYLNGNQWTDVEAQNQAATAKHFKIVFGSDDYFALLAKYPDAAQYFALGNNITVVLGGSIYDIVEESSK